MGKVLVIGNTSSIWIKEYIKNIHIKFGNKVYATDYYGLTEEDKEFYRALGVVMIPLHQTNSIKKILCYRREYKKFARENGKDLELIDIQSPPHSIQTRILENLIDSCNAKTVTTFWGSDILRTTKEEASNMRGILKRSEWINIGTIDMHETLREKVGSEFDSKCVYIGFGSPAMSEIEKCKLTRGECKEYFGLNPNKRSIAVGYNWRKEQQHIEAINSLAELSSKYKEQIEIVVHTGPNIDAEYLKDIVSALESSEISYVINRQMLSLEKIAILRLATDIMLHAQTTDGLSGTIRECVYAGAILVNPTWLKYDKFDRDGVDYIQYSQFSDLSSIIENILDKKIIVDTEKNKKILFDEFSWNAVEGKWAQIFNERVN